MQHQRILPYTYILPCGAANILHGAAVILPGISSIVIDVLDVQHQFFEIFHRVLGFSKGKIQTELGSEPKLVIITLFFRAGGQSQNW